MVEALNADHYRVQVYLFELLHELLYLNLGEGLHKLLFVDVYDFAD